MKTPILILLFFFLLFSCTDKHNSSNQDEKTIVDILPFTLQIEDTLTILLDDKTPFNGAFKIETINNIEYLGILNRDYNDYRLYGLISGNLDKHFKFKRSGPDGIGQARFVLVHNWDSIFVTRYHTNQLFMLDSTASIKQKWELTFTESDQLIHNISASFNFQLKFQNNQIYCKNISIFKVFTKDYWKTALGLRYDIKNQILYNSSGFFSYVFKEGVNYGSWNYHGYQILSNSNQQIYSFSLDNNLYIYNETALIKKVSLCSPHVPVDAPKPHKTLTGYNSQDDWLYEIQRGSYRWMVYDEHQDIIYRLVVHAMEPYDTDGNKNKFWDKPFSIQIIDSTLNLIGEVNFPGKQYDFRNIIPSKHGLLISICHNDNPLLEEDKLKLVRLKLLRK